MPNIEYLSLLGNPACPDQLSAAGPETTNNPQDDYQHYRFVLSAYFYNLLVNFNIYFEMKTIIKYTS